MSKPGDNKNGAVVWRGTSSLDGCSEIAVIVVGFKTASRNRKTGGMLQAYILRVEGTPIANTLDGSDYAICGDCKHRKANIGSCYVNTAKGPGNVFKCLSRDGYPTRDPHGLCAGYKLRIGAYGDPAAVPGHVWQALLVGTVGHTGYTHQWDTRPDLAACCMASVDSLDELNTARAAGWRTFRVRKDDEPLQHGEFVCPASHEGGQRVHCDTCLACDGNERKQFSPAIVAHGATASRFIKLEV